MNHDGSKRGPNYDEEKGREEVENSTKQDELTNVDEK